MTAMSIEETVRGLSDEQVTKIVNSMKFDVNINERAENICYDRLLCQLLGIDYNRINNVDFARAYVYCYWRETDG